MVDRIQDSQGNYIAATYEELKSFMDQAVHQRLELLVKEDENRSLRFKGDAEKHRELHQLHLNNKPDLSNQENKEELRRWNQRLLELERSAQTAERQYSLHSKAMLEPNMDLVRRQARRQVSEQEPDIYAAYQASRKAQRIEKLWADLNAATEKFDTLLKEGAATRHINPTAKKIERLATSLEKSDDYTQKTTDAERQRVAAAKTKSTEFLQRSGKDRGWENG